jgi:predicted dehydrogenase
MVKILLVGCGYWGKNWYNTITLSECELVGVVDPNPVISVDVPLFNSIEEVDIEYTHVIIATNAESHFDLKNKLKCPDKNILIEKPCGTSETRDQLLECFPGYIFLSSPQFKYIKHILDNNKLGDIIYSRFERASMGPRIRTDVSIIEDYAIHDLYLYQALFEYDSAVVSDVRLLNSFNPPIKPDTLFLTLSHDNHISTFFSSWRHPLKTRKIEIVGKKGSLVWKDEEILLYSNCYNEIEGLDNNRNVGYELINNPEQKIELNQTKSNLHLQLDDFINEQNRNKIFINTNNLIKKINYGN